MAPAPIVALVALAAFALALPLAAQTGPEHRPPLVLRVGIKGGYNVSDLAVRPETGLDHYTAPRTSGVRGVYLEYGVGSALALRLEALRSRKGASVTIVERWVQNDHIDYLEFPLLLLVRVPTGLAVRPVFAVGPALAVCEGEQAGCGGPYTGNRYHTTDLGLALGAGAEVVAGRFAVHYDGRYTYGLYDVDRRTSEMRNRVWSFAAGLGYRLF